MWWFRGSESHLPEPKGKFTPGCCDLQVGFSKNGFSARLYYPTNVKKGNPLNAFRYLPWMSDSKYILGIAKVLMTFTFIIRLVFWWTAKNIPALYGCKPRTEQRLKCVIISHGLGGFRNLYSNTCCELASRGFLVLALEHRDQSACHTYYYKNKEYADMKIQTSIGYKVINLGKHHLKARKEQVIYRANECSKAVDFLINLNEGCIPEDVVFEKFGNLEVNLQDFFQKLDVTCLTIAGHSFGAATALLTLKLRNELRQAILLDPWMFPIKDESLEEIQKPLIFINTQTFHIAQNVEAMSKFLTRNNTMYTILQTTHESQTDTALIVGYWLNWFMKKMKPIVALDINNALIMEFLDQQVGCPTSIADCQNILALEKSKVMEGLTKPWA